MKRIGLTGGIGSGKSTLAGMLAELGVPVLDLDALGRELHKDADCRAALLAAFGHDILDSSGAVDRGALGRLCFADAEKTATLNRIMHPRIWQEEQVWLAAQQGAYVLIEASVLIESGGAARMDAIVVVLADLDTRRQRVVQSRGMEEHRFDAIVARQCDDAARWQAADFIVENNNGLDVLQQAAAGLHQQLLSLSAIEYCLVQAHTKVGYDILKDIAFPWPVADIAHQHHEHMDGSGYPQGLKGADICMEARIVAVADVVEAIASHRPYRPALGIEKALDEIRTQRGTFYDPKVVDACLKLFAEGKFSFNIN